MKQRQEYLESRKQEQENRMKQEILRLIAMKMAGKKTLKEQDLSKSIAKMVPVPHYSLHKKYAFFYDPYS